MRLTIYLWPFRMSLYLISTSQNARRLLLPHTPSRQFLHHSNRTKRRKLVRDINPQNRIPYRVRISTGSPQCSGQWLTKWLRSRLGNKTSVKSFESFRARIITLSCFPISVLVTGETRLRVTRLFGQKKLFRMLRKASFQVVIKHATMFLWVIHIICRTITNIRNRTNTLICLLKLKLL